MGRYRLFDLSLEPTFPFLPPLGSGPNSVQGKGKFKELSFRIQYLKDSVQSWREALCLILKPSPPGIWDLFCMFFPFYFTLCSGLVLQSYCHWDLTF